MALGDLHAKKGTATQIAKHIVKHYSRSLTIFRATMQILYVLKETYYSRRECLKAVVVHIINKELIRVSLMK